MANASIAAGVFVPIEPHATGMPLYRVVKRSILRAIESRHLRPGEALPSEAELSAAFAVAVGTVRRALDELATEHIVVRRQGRGTFVATQDTGRLLFRFFRVERNDGLRELPDVRLLSFQRVAAAEDVAQGLGLRTGESVVAIENVLRLQGRPVIHDRIFVPALVFRGLTERRVRDRSGTLYQLYQSEFGLSVLRALERVRAMAAERSAARALAIAPGAPVLEVRRTALTFGDRPVEYRISVVDTSRHDYVNELAQPVLS